MPSRELLVDFLDKHCQMENQKAEAEGDDAVISAYDFVYLPLDLRYAHVIESDSKRDAWIREDFRCTCCFFSNV